jgi:hypothetical protein
MGENVNWNPEKSAIFHRQKSAAEVNQISNGRQ